MILYTVIAVSSQKHCHIHQDRVNAIVSRGPFLTKGPKPTLLLSFIFPIFRCFPASVYDLMDLISQSKQIRLKCQVSIFLGINLDIISQREDGLVEFLYLIPFLPDSRKAPL